MDIAKVTYPGHKCDCAPNITGIPPYVVILENMDKTKKSFDEIRGNIEHDFTGLVG